MDVIEGLPIHKDIFLIILWVWIWKLEISIRNLLITIPSYYLVNTYLWEIISHMVLYVLQRQSIQQQWRCCISYNEWYVLLVPVRSIERLTSVLFNVRIPMEAFLWNRHITLLSIYKMEISCVQELWSYGITCTHQNKFIIKT